MSVSAGTRQPGLEFLCVALVFGVLGLAACDDGNSSTSTPTPTRAPTPTAGVSVIIDTDSDSDDAMAILYLLSAPDVRVEAITVTGTGFLPLIDGVPVDMKLAAIAGKPNVPVAYGSNFPITLFGGFPEEWIQGALRFYQNANLPALATSPSAVAAPQLIIDIVEHSAQKVTILGLGPMTNIALALQEKPDIVNNIERIVLSAGAFHVAGNIVTTPPQLLIEDTASYRALAALVDEGNTAEYNVLLDAQGIDVILQSGAPVLFSPLDASQEAPVTEQALDALKNVDNPVARFVVGDIAPLVGQMVPAYFWDPVAASLVVDPTICTDRQEVKVAVEIDDDATFGTTRELPYGTPADVCFKIDVAKFMDSFITVISNAN